MTNMTIIRATNIVFTKKRPSELESSISSTSEAWSAVLLVNESDLKVRNRVQDSRMMELSKRMLVPIPTTIEIRG